MTLWKILSLCAGLESILLDLLFTPRFTGLLCTSGGCLCQTEILASSAIQVQKRITGEGLRCLICQL